MKTVYLVYEVNLYEQDFGAIDSDEVPVAVFQQKSLPRIIFISIIIPNRLTESRGMGNFYIWNYLLINIFNYNT